MQTFARIASAALVAAGLLGAGWLAGQGITRFRTDDRYVTVKGSAERTVDADLVVWPLAHSVLGSDLAGLQSQLDANTAAIQRFFTEAGFGPGEVSVAPPRLEDRWTYSSVDNRPPERYRYSTTVTLRTTQVPKALAALRGSGRLVAQGVQLGGEGGEGASAGGPSFEFTHLNTIKPALIAEATSNARRSAEQFAKDSGAHVAGIRSANQGVVSIEDRDAGSPHVKTVRVVSTVEYFLRD